MKKLLAMILVLGMVLTMVACSDSNKTSSQDTSSDKSSTETADTTDKSGTGTADTTKKLKCGIILDYMGASIFVEAVNSIKEVASTMDVEIITWDCQVSPESMVQGLENFIASDVDMIYLQNWTGYEAIKSVVEKALEQGITIVAYDDEVPGAVYCTMADFDALGYALGDEAIEIFKKYAKAEDDIIVLTAAMNTEYGVARTNLAIERIKQELPKANIITMDVVTYGGSGQSTGVQIGETLLSSYNNVAAIIAADNSNTAIGIAEAYKAAGITDGLGVATMDGSLEEFKAIADDSVFYATVDLGLVELMTDLFVKGINYIRTGEVKEPTQVYFYNTIVSKENIDQYYDVATGQRILK